MCPHCMKGNGCGCSCGSSSYGNDCVKLGPFVAVDVACLPKSKAKASATGSIIPFSSGLTPIVLSTVLGGLVGTPSIIGFGSAVPGVEILNNTLDLTSVITESFTAPSDLSITAISATFTPTIGVTLLGNTSVKAQIFKAPAGSSIFTATDATVTLAPAYTGPITTGLLSSSSATISPVEVAQGERLVMVYSLEVSGVSVAQVLTGTASAGITIS